MRVFASEKGWVRVCDSVEQRLGSPLLLSHKERRFLSAHEFGGIRRRCLVMGKSQALTFNVTDMTALHADLKAKGSAHHPGTRSSTVAKKCNYLKQDLAIHIVEGKESS